MHPPACCSLCINVSQIINYNVKAKRPCCITYSIIAPCARRFLLGLHACASSFTRISLCTQGVRSCSLSGKFSVFQQSSKIRQQGGKSSPVRSVRLQIDFHGVISSLFNRINTMELGWNKARGCKGYSSCVWGRRQIKCTLQTCHIGRGCTRLLYLIPKINIRGYYLSSQLSI